LEFAFSSLAAASDEQYESIFNDEITLLVRKFYSLHRFHKERRRSLRGCFECGDTTHFITDCPKWKKLDSSNKYSTATGTTPVTKARARRSTASGTRRRRSSRR
jgi:hypothetical protein